MTPALFVAGTDTGVGKTRVGVALCRHLRETGRRVGVLKIAETGCPPDAPPDALALLEASGCRAPLDMACPYRFEEPMAPAVAAERAGVFIDPARIDACLAALRDTHDVVVCEGAGGLLVPLSDGLLTLDWIARHRLPVLLVGRLGLGTINHTLLSVRALREAAVPLVGTVLSATEPPADAASRTNPDVLLSFPEARFLGVIEHKAHTLPQAVTDAAAALLI